ARRAKRPESKSKRSPAGGSRSAQDPSPRGVFRMAAQNHRELRVSRGGRLGASPTGLAQRAPAAHLPAPVGALDFLEIVCLRAKRVFRTTGMQTFSERRLSD